MGWLSGLFTTRRELDALRSEIERLKAVQDVQAPDFLRAGIGDHPELPPLRMVDAQAELYQRLSWVYVAVTITAQTAAGAQFNVSEWQGEKTTSIENHPFELLLRNPNPLQSRLEFLEALFAFRQLTGNAYIWLNRTTPDAPPSEMWIIPSQQIEPIPDKNLYISGYAYDPGDGRKIPLETWEVCHLKRYHPRNQFVGLSPIEALAITATGDLAMAQWNTNFFDKQHAKPAGALAFADRINDADWERIKRDVRDDHGGVSRKMMMLRNAGTAGAKWIQFGVSQKDMEFLRGREFNKEEIFAAFAPGLSSMLAVNATEANSKTGKATFAETTIWPSHQAVAEKFTSDILPAYGDNLVGAFEDVRVTDRALALQEQTTAYQVMTISEAREKFYNLGPLGDARDSTLVAGTAAPIEPIDVEPPPPAPTRAKEATPPTPDPVRADLLRWQRKATKRAKAGRTGCAFESAAIAPTLNAAIRGALDAAADVDAVRAVFAAVLDGGDLAPLWENYP
jgi:HK97 family phage portal protein